MDISGFVDLQVNGFTGVDFSSPDLTREAFIDASRELFARGTAAFLPTLITSSLDTYRLVLPLIAEVMDEPEFEGRLLGIHLEGPFLSPKPGAIGAHDPSLVQPPSIEVFDQLQEWARGKIKLLTIAADADGAVELTRHAVTLGVAVSVGHHMATARNLEQVADAGATALTHLGNGIPNQIHRHNNAIWAGLAEDRLTAMLIADGHHLPDPVLKSIIRAKGVERVVITSDAAPLAGMPAGEYQVWGARIVLEESGLLHDPEKGNLAGSSSTIIQCMNHLASLDILNRDELLAVGFFNPLRLIGVRAESIHSDSILSYDDQLRRFVVAS